MSETPQVIIGEGGATPLPSVPGVIRMNVSASSICDGILVSWDNVNGARSLQVKRSDGTLVYSGPFIRNYPDTTSTRTPPTCGFQYTYTVMAFRNSNRTSLLAQGSDLGSPVTACVCPLLASGFLIESRVDTFESRKGSFEVLFPRGTVIVHYTHRKGSLQGGRWKRVNTLKAPAGGTVLDNAISLIQSASGNFEAVAVVTPLEERSQNYLVSYVFEPDSGWQGPSVLTAGGHPIGATGPTALIQTQQGYFVLFVPQDNSIGRYMHEPGSIKDGLWTPFAPFGSDDQVTYTAISLVQDASRQLDLIAKASPVQAPQQGASTDYLVSFVASGSVDPQAPFTPVGRVLADGQPITGVTGNTTCILDARGIFELIVPLGARMDQYILETGSIGDNLWKHVSTLEPLKNDPGIQFTATSQIQSTSGKLELVARAKPPAGQGADFLVSYEFTGWKGPRPILVNGTSENEDNDRDERDAS